MYWTVDVSNKEKQKVNNYSVFQLRTKAVGIVINFSLRNHILCKILKPMTTQIKLECLVL